jgi:hypothetical protein
VRSTNRQCGPRGPNSGRKITAARRESNRRQWLKRQSLLESENLVRAALVAFALAPVIVGCTPIVKSGIAQMSDKWCAKHPTATVNRCWEHAHVQEKAMEK